MGGFSDAFLDGIASQLLPDGELSICRQLCDCRRVRLSPAYEGQTV